MRRLSPSSQLVLLAVVLALLLAALAGLARGKPDDNATASPGAESSSAFAAASPTLTQRPSGPPATTATPGQTPLATVPSGSITLADLLALLSTAPEQRAGYDRSLFRHWIDADGDGCDTRREVLIEESLTTVTVSATCSSSGGSWVSLYDGLVFTDASGLDIDHVVALAEAWDSGAFGWSADRRERFANDLGASWSLIAVSASSNRTKSDQDPADWLPPTASYLCPYLADWIAVKVRWSLAVDTRERDALTSLIAGCPEERMPVLLTP